MNSYVVSRILPGIVLSLMVAFIPHDGEGGPKDVSNSAAPGIGGNGPWSSLNMQLLGRLTLTELGSGGVGNVIGNDCWGWTDPQNGKEYAICGLTNKTSFVDISDPTDPKYLGNLPTQTGNSSWRDMKVYDNHVFIVSDGNGDHGMQVFDLTNLRNVNPNNPQVFSNSAWYGGVTKAHNIAINESTGFAYLVGSNQASGGLHILDISNPLNPVIAADYSADGYTHDAQIVTYNGPDTNYIGQEIAFCSNEDTVTIVDVTDKNAMLMLSRNEYAQDAYTHQGWLSEDHRYFYMGDELDESNFGGPTRTHVFDCLDLQNPVYKGYYSGSTNSIDHNLYIKAGRLYCGNYSSGIRVLQMGADPTQLTEVAYFDTYNTNTGVNYNGVWSVYPFFNSDVIVVNDRQNGMFLVKLAPIGFSYQTSRPSMIHSGGQAEFQVSADDLFGSPQPGTGVLHVDRGNGFEEFPMNEVSSNLYEAVFPSTHCGSEVQYFVSAMATDGSMACSPTNAPTDTWSAISGYSLDSTFTDNFETDQGWSVSGDATDGHWERGIPAGGGLRADPPADSDGSGQCYVTDNVAGNSDVDGGSTILTSPVFNAAIPGSMHSILSYYRWYSNDLGGAPNADVFVVDISNDGGSTWVNLETVGPTGNEISGGWINKSIRISDHVVPTNQMRLRFTASDLGDGSVIEAGVDGLKVEVIDCLQTLLPSFEKLGDGRVNSGALADLFLSDNDYYIFDPEPTSNPEKQHIELFIQADVPGFDPTELRFKLEAKMNGGPSGDVIQELSLFDYVTHQYELIDVRAAATVDNLIDVGITGDPSRFVSPIGELTAFVKWSSPTFAGSQFSWNIDVDQMVWAFDEAPASSFKSAPPVLTPVDPGKTIKKKRGSR